MPSTANAITVPTTHRAHSDGPNRYVDRRADEHAVRRLYESRFAIQYDRRAQLWERTLGARAEQALRTRLTQLPRRPLAVLDLGCGNARNLAKLRSSGVEIGDYLGIDRSAPMLQAAPPTGSSVRFGTAELTDPDSYKALPQYDLVLLTWVLSHLGDPAALLNRAQQTLAPDGTLIVATLTNTTNPTGRTIGRRFRQLHATPIDHTILTQRRPTTLDTGLCGLTTVATFNSTKPTLRSH